SVYGRIRIKMRRVAPVKIAAPAQSRIVCGRSNDFTLRFVDGRIIHIDGKPGRMKTVRGRRNGIGVVMQPFLMFRGPERAVEMEAYTVSLCIRYESIDLWNHRLVEIGMAHAGQRNG